MKEHVNVDEHQFFLKKKFQPEKNELE